MKKFVTMHGHMNVKLYIFICFMYLYWIYYNFSVYVHLWIIHWWYHHSSIYWRW